MIIRYNDIGKNWSTTFQDEGSTIMLGIKELHDKIFYYIIIIIIIVGYILFIELYKNKNIELEKIKNLRHSTMLEIIWTITPGIILIIIAIPSFKLLYNMDEIIKPNLTLKVKGFQWYWNYSIEDIDNIKISFDSYTKSDEDLLLGEFRLLDVDNRIILPYNTPIRYLVTAEDVIHSWAIPSLGIKLDCIPGRINQGEMYILRPGLYYGQCSELCGQLHNGMSIVIEAISMKDFISYLLSHSNISSFNLINLVKSFKDLLF